MGNPEGKYVFAFFPTCAVRFRFFCDPPWHFHSMYISTYSLYQASFNGTDSFVKILLFVTVLGSYGTTISVTSEVSSCKYIYTYIINLNSNIKCLQLLLGVFIQVWKSFYESVIKGRIWLTCLCYCWAQNREIIPQEEIWLWLHRILV